MKIIQTIVLASAVALAAAPARAQSPLNVVTTTEDLAAIAREVGGDKITVESIARGYQDPHFVEAKPSFILKLQKADLLIAVGRELEVGWLPPLVQQSRNRKIQPGADGYLDASTRARILDVPTGQITRAMGDVHPQGNPHYWLDPENGLTIAANIRDAFSRNDPANRSFYESRYAAFQGQLQGRLAGWKKRAADLKLGGMKVATYHRSWPYFAQAFGLQVLDYVEPRPGVPPAPKHVQEMTELMKAQGARLLIVEPYFDPKLPRRIAQNAGATLVVLPPSVGAVPAAKDYFSLFDAQLDLIQRALSGGRS